MMNLKDLIKRVEYCKKESNDTDRYMHVAELGGIRQTIRVFNEYVRLINLNKTMNNNKMFDGHLGEVMAFIFIVCAISAIKIEVARYYYS